MSHNRGDPGVPSKRALEYCSPSPTEHSTTPRSRFTHSIYTDFASLRSVVVGGGGDEPGQRTSDEPCVCVCVAFLCCCTIFVTFPNPFHHFVRRDGNSIPPVPSVNPKAPPPLLVCLSGRVCPHAQHMLFSEFVRTEMHWSGAAAAAAGKRRKAGKPDRMGEEREKHTMVSDLQAPTAGADTSMERKKGV